VHPGFRAAFEYLRKTDFTKLPTGRNEIDDMQEIHYPGIMRAIAETGYKGFVGQEFIPTRNPLDGLKQAITVCDV